MVRAHDPRFDPQGTIGSRGACGSRGQLNGNEPTFAVFVFAPWLCLLLVLVAGVLGRGDGGLAWAVFVALFVYSIWHALLHIRGRENSVASQSLVGLLCGIACCMGLFVSLHARDSYLSEYWRVDGGASYFNVLPSDTAGGHSDAAAVTFASGTRVDESRTYGYLDGVFGSGDVYCVAPIADRSTATDGSTVQFWAVGVNCCYQRSGFNCEDSANADAKGGIVIDNNSVDGINFQRAIQGAEFAYGIYSAREHVLLKWVLDPTSWHQKLWHHTLQLVLTFSCVYLVFSCMVGFTLSQTLKQ